MNGLVGVGIVAVMVAVVFQYVKERSKMVDTYDLLVVGGGLAGLTVALQASSEKPDMRILLVDKEPHFGGNSAKASSGINAAVDDTDITAFIDETLRSGGGLARSDLVSVLAEESSNAISFLGKHGIDLPVFSQLGGHSRPRTRRSGSGGANVGYYIISKLVEALEARNTTITVRKGTAVIGMVQIAGQPGFTVTLREANTNSEILAKTVCLCTGGFAANPSLLPESIRHLSTTNGPWATGDGLWFVPSAHLVDMEQVQIHPTGFIDPSNRNSRTRFLAPEALRGSGGLLFNVGMYIVPFRRIKT